jgi:hypothetical protein
MSTLYVRVISTGFESPWFTPEEATPDVVDRSWPRELSETRSEFEYNLA